MTGILGRGATQDCYNIANRSHLFSAIDRGPIAPFTTIGSGPIFEAICTSHRMQKLFVKMMGLKLPKTMPQTFGQLGRQGGLAETRNYMYSCNPRQAKHTYTPPWLNIVRVHTFSLQNQQQKHVFQLHRYLCRQPVVDDSSEGLKPLAISWRHKPNFDAVKRRMRYCQPSRQWHCTKSHGMHW